MDVTQATGSGGLLNPKVRIKEEDPGDPDAGEGKEGAAPPKMVGRSWEEVGRKVKEEPEEEPSGNWDARLQAFLKTLHSPHSTGGTPPLPERKGGKDPKRPPAPSQGMAGANKWPEGQWASPNQPRCVGKAEQGEETPLEASRRGEKETEGLLAEDAAGAERQCRRFRTLCYDDAAGPRELCGQLLELCRQWLKPERHTKEQMVELVTLEQFLAILPLEMQSWLRQNDPVTCAEAVTLAEDFLLSRQEARDWERQVLGISEEEPSQHLPEVKIHLFEETKQEGEENVGLLTGGGWPRQSEEEQRLPGSPEKTERVTLLKTDQEDDSLSRGDLEENKMGLKGQNGTDEEEGEDPPVHQQEVTCKEAIETAVQLDERLQGHEGGEVFVPGSELPGRERSPGEEAKCYKCWHCGQSFGSSSELLLHERNHVGEQLYKCSHCGGSERVHMGRKPRKCSHCGNTFGCNPQQETNGETKLHTCSECGEKYIHVSGLARHQKTHRGEKAYKCLKCGENFGAYSGLRAHWRTHTGENQYKCLQCEMCFSGITRLRAHEKVHMAVCSSCGKNFSQKSELIEHERTHARENSFVCLDCGKAFGFHSELVAHVRTHRDKKLECPDSKNTLICSECGDTFRHSSALKAHQRVHKGEHKREQQDQEESAERPREIKREPEEEAPPSEEPRKKQKLTMETRIGRAAATEATTTQATAMAAASEAEAATEGAGAEAAAMAVVKIEVADEMSEARMADEEEPPHQEEEAERQPAGMAAAATQPPVPWFGFEDAVTSLSQKGKNLIVQGNYCLPAVKKLNSGITSSASHVDQHLKKADPEKLRDILDLKQGRRSMYSEDSPEEEEKKEEEEEESPTAVQSKRPALETVTQKMLDRTLVDYVVEEMVPVQTVDRPAFVALVRLGLPSGLKILRPQALRERIEEKAAVMKEALTSRMRAAEYVATTADCWREGRKSFLGVTAHWISPTTLKREFGALACRRLKGGLTYSVLAKALRDVHLQFGIDGKVVCATTDNGSPFVEAFRAFEAQELREAEGGDGDEDENDDREAPEVEFVPISEILDAGDNGKGQEEAGSAGLPPHQRCASYTLNLIATRDVEAMISDAPETSPLGLFGKHFRSLLRKCGQLWSKQKRSAETAEYVYRQCGDYLKTPDGSRWSAVFEALKQLHRLLSAAPLKMDAVMERCALARFTSEERVALQEYTEALAPLCLSLDILQRENNVFMGYLLPTVYSLDRKFQGLENKPAPSVYTLPLLRGLRQALRKRFAPVWEDKQLLLAACLHPRFKLDWLESSKSAQTNRFAMEALLNAELKGPVSEAGEDSLEKEEEGDDILLDFFDIQPRRRASALDPGEEELSKYLVNPSREVSSLLAFPIIRQSFLKYNTGLPSSAAAERLFGTDGNLMTARRRSLPDDVFEQLVLLRQNRVSPALS